MANNAQYVWSSIRNDYKSWVVKWENRFFSSRKECLETLSPGDIFLPLKVPSQIFHADPNQLQVFMGAAKKTSICLLIDRFDGATKRVYFYQYRYRLLGEATVRTGVLREDIIIWRQIQY